MADLNAQPDQTGGKGEKPPGLLDQKTSPLSASPPLLPPSSPKMPLSNVSLTEESLLPPPHTVFLPEEAPPPSPKPQVPEAPSPLPPEEKVTFSPRLSPEPPPPPPSGRSPSEEKEPSASSAVRVSQPKPLILKILAPLLGILILAGLILAGWKFVWPLLPAGFKPGGATLTYWGLWEDEDILKPVIEDFEKSHRGIRIDYKKQNPKEYRERLQAALAAGSGPDIFRFHNTWLPMLKNDLSPVPEGVFSVGDFQKTFYPVAAQDLKEGNSYYGIPLEIDGLALLCNLDIFKAAGLEPPTTWEDFQKAARLLTVKDEKGKIQTAGVALGTTSNVDNWSDILAVMFLQNGVDLKSPQGKLAEDALIFYTSFAQGENKTWDETLPPSTLAFAQGKAAMIFAPSWQILTIKATNPQIKLKVLPLSQLPGVRIAWASYWVEGVALKSAHQAQAWEFLKYLSQKETLTKLYTEASKTRLFGEPYSRQDLASSLKDDPYLAPYIQQASYARSFYLASRTFDNGINDKLIKYLEDAVNSVNRGLAPRAALETATKGIQQALSTYGISVPNPP